jgi:hypothetical protein
MKCEVPRELLSGYLDGELDRKQKAELEKHLRECEQCRNELEELKRLDQQVRTSEIEEPSRDFFFQLNRRIMQKVKKKPRVSLFRLSPILVPVAAAALVLIVLLNIQQPTRLVSLDDRILYAEVETRKDLDLQIPELGVVEEIAREKGVVPEGKVRYRPAAKKREVVIAAEPPAVQDEAVGVLSVEALQIPADKIVRAIVDSTGRIVKVATGNTIIPEKDTLLENKLQGQQISPPTVAGRRAQLYVDFTQKQEKK